MAYTALSAGELDKRVTIQARTEVDDGGAGQTITWTPWLTRWVAISPGGGREFTVAQQIQPELTHTIRMRFLPGLTAKHRLVYTANGIERVFLIHAVLDPEERHEALTLLCSEEPRA